ncbi:MAG: c-type cytochrome biogenesis protein CcmI, partial [Rubrivivax sp.]
MSLFWVVAVAMLLLAMWMLAGTLWRKPARKRVVHSASQSNLEVLKTQLLQLDQDLASGTLDAPQHQRARAEIERRVFDEEGVGSAPETVGSPRATRAMLVLGVPVLALALYAAIGTPRALSPEAVIAQGEPAAHEMDAMVAKLAERMEKQPPGQVADTEGWVMLGRSYAAMQRFPEAQRALSRALQLSPDDAQILADQADVLAMLQGRNLEGEPLRLVDRALKNDPSNLKALALAGTAAFERKDFAGAVRYWTRARAVAPPDSEFGQGLERGLAEARAAAAAAGVPSQSTAGSTSAVSTPAPATAGATAAPDAAPATVAAAAAAGVASISGRVSLSPALAARVAPGDTVFVFARAAEGPRMPLAILKRSVGELPLSFTLDDNMAMTPEFKLSKFAQVVIGARVSKSGNATPQSGDLEGLS